MKDLITEINRMKNLFEHKRGQVISEQDTIYDIVQSTDNPKTGEKYKWKEVRHAYQLEKQPKTAEGKYDTNMALRKDWINGWRPGQSSTTGSTQNSGTTNSAATQTISADTQTVQTKEPGYDEDASNFSLSTNEPGKDDEDKKSDMSSEPGSDEEEEKKDKVENEPDDQNPSLDGLTPEQLYKKLYDLKLITGEGKYKVRYKGTPELTPDQQKNFTEAMDKMGYKFYRKGNDNRLVYTKKEVPISPGSY